MREEASAVTCAAVRRGSLPEVLCAADLMHLCDEVGGVSLTCAPVDVCTCAVPALRAYPIFAPKLNGDNFKSFQRRVGAEGALRGVVGEGGPPLP